MQLVFTLIALLVLFGCETKTRLPDLYDPSEFSRTFQDRVRLQMAAPIIVVGVVERFRVSEESTPSQRDKRINLDWTEVTIQVEQTIQGSITSKNLNFGYYNYSSHNERDLGLRRYLPNAGQRRVFFLTRSSGGYRSIGDVVDYTFPLRSGHHSEDFCTHESVGCCIAKLILVPGSDYEQPIFGDELVREVWAASIFCSNDYALQLVRGLQKSNDPRVARVANQIVAAESRGEK